MSEQPKKCGAKTKSGGICKLVPIKGKKRCKFHGGLSTGPKDRAKAAQAKKGNINRATPGSPRSKYLSVEQQRLEQEYINGLSPSQILELLMKNTAVQSLDAMRKAASPQWEETKIVEKEGFPVSGVPNAADPNGTTTTKEIRDYDKIAADRANTTARLAGAWATVKRIEEPGDGKPVDDAQSAADEIEDMVKDAVNEAKEREEALSSKSG